MLAVSAGAQEKVYSEQGEYKLSLEQILVLLNLLLYMLGQSINRFMHFMV